MTTFLVTGGAGFIGSSLVDRLLKDNHKVITIDNFNDYYSPERKYLNIQEQLTYKTFKLYKADIEDLQVLEKVFEENKIDCVIHLAARAGVRPSIQNPIEYAKTNILGTINILECMKKYEVKKLIMASSSSVYGNCKNKKFSEDINVHQPISPYAATKLACEEISYTYHKLYGLKIYPLRFFTVYGPRQRPDLAINKFITLINKNLPIDMYGDGSSMRDYTYIDDIISGIIAVIKYNKTDFEIFNLGGGNPITLKCMISTIENALDKKADIRSLPMQPGDVDKTIADISKAKELLNYNPQTPFYLGIKKYIEWEKSEENKCQKYL